MRYYVDDDDDPSPVDFDDPNDWHGTRVASLAVAAGTHKAVGVSYESGFYAVRVLDSNMDGTLGHLIKGIEWASDEPHKADVISISIGKLYDHTPNFSYAHKVMFENVCNAAYDKGIVLVAGSGNDGFDYSAYPAAFDTVISVGSYQWNPGLPPVFPAYYVIGVRSNGGVDVLAPGVHVEVLDPCDTLSFDSGTSMATPHVSGLIALQLEYARKHGMKANNVCHRQAVSHAAIPLKRFPMDGFYDPVEQGEGKAWAAASDSNDPSGSLDLLAAHWPVQCEFEFADYARAYCGYPVYHIGADVVQSIRLTNITDVMGNTPEVVADVNVTVTFTSSEDSTALPGQSTTVFPMIPALDMGPLNAQDLPVTYTVPAGVTPGLKQTTVSLEFHFTGSDRVIKVSYTPPEGRWYATHRGDLPIEAWEDYGRPECWCNRRQCHGDADGEKQGSDKTGHHYVGTDDLNVLIAAWLVAEPPHGPGIASVPDGICADFAHDQGGSNKTGVYRVGPADLNILIANWLKKEPPQGQGIPPDCLDCP